MSNGNGMIKKDGICVVIFDSGVVVVDDDVVDADDGVVIVAVAELFCTFMSNGNGIIKNTEFV